jgi:hypothetical protein
MENERWQTCSVPEMRQTSGVCDGFGGGAFGFTAASSEREDSCHMHGLRPEKQVTPEPMQKTLQHCRLTQ